MPIYFIYSEESGSCYDYFAMNDRVQFEVSILDCFLRKNLQIRNLDYNLRSETILTVCLQASKMFIVISIIWNVKTYKKAPLSF